MNRRHRRRPGTGAERPRHRLVAGCRLRAALGAECHRARPQSRSLRTPPRTDRSLRRPPADADLRWRLAAGRVDAAWSTPRNGAGAPLPALPRNAATVAGVTSTTSWFLLGSPLARRWPRRGQVMPSALIALPHHGRSGSCLPALRHAARRRFPASGTSVRAACWRSRSMSRPRQTMTSPSIRSAPTG